MSREHNQQIANNPRQLRNAAKEALKTAKMLERQRMANGAKWVKGPNRSWVLGNEKYSEGEPAETKSPIRG